MPFARSIAAPATSVQWPLVDPMSKQFGVVCRIGIFRKPASFQFGERKAYQRISIARKPNNVDKCRRIIQFPSRTDGLADYVDLPQLRVLPYAARGEPVFACRKT